MLVKLIKQSLYRSGLYGALHKRRNRNTLTVPMFHRVLPRRSKDWQFSDPEWTVDTEYFRSCLRFFKKYYQIISIRQLPNFLEHRDTSDKPRLLVTFDDGWRDNLQYAIPILEEENVPALFFVTSGALKQKHLAWQEILDTAWRRGDLQASILPQLTSLIDLSPDTPIDNIHKLKSLSYRIEQLLPSDFEQVASVLHNYADSLPDRLMLNTEELREMAARGFDVGSHSSIHQPLPSLLDQTGPMKQSAEYLKQVLGRPIFSFSFPHSQHDDETLKSARQSPYRYLFSGENRANLRLRAADNGGDRQIFWRTQIDQTYMCDKLGNFSATEIANQLFRLTRSRPLTLSDTAA